MFVRLKEEEFEKTVGLLDYDDLEDLSIKPTYCHRAFKTTDLQMLEDFCKKNPKYHIISAYGGYMFINFVSPWATIYFLGKGDKNPDLIYYRSKSLKAYLRTELFILLRNEGFTLRDALELEKSLT